ncbi:MAG: hypothetical protein V4510_11525 [bacterium]
MRALPIAMTALLVSVAPIPAADAGSPLSPPSVNELVNAIVTITDVLQSAPCLAPTVPLVDDCPSDVGNTTIGCLIGVVNKWAEQTPGPTTAYDDVATCLDGFYCVEFWVFSQETFRTSVRPTFISTGGGYYGVDFMIDSGGVERDLGTFGLGAYRLRAASASGAPHC